MALTAPSLRRVPRKSTAGRFRRAVVLCALISLMAPGCAYPRRTTAISPTASAPTGSAPASVVRIAFQGADIPVRDRGNRAWDTDGTPPDSRIRIYRDDELIYESETWENALQPIYDFTTPNLYLPRSSSTRIELWDDDLGQLAVIGRWQGRGVPSSALMGADAHLNLEGGAVLRFRLEQPVAHRGIGIVEYEVRADRLLVLDVVRFSPAGRADIRRGDAIVAIDGRPISELGDHAAASALSMSASRQSTLTVSRDDAEREARIDGGYIWRVE